MTQCISIDQATQAASQRTHPCTDCPMARTALPGWLGGAAPQDMVLELVA